ncbi:MAG: PbsX family transcriptional regulator [Nitrospirae bacterium]|nr:PbsX family transcriptional regulator [Candidatus Manganitrophaceae bacterium]
MKAKIQKWGNSLAVRVGIAEEAGVKSNDMVEMNVEDGKIVLLPEIALEYRLDDLLEGITDENLHSEVETGEPVGREIL